MAGYNKRNKIQEYDMQQIVYGWLMLGYSNKKVVEELQLKYDYKYDNAQRLIQKVVKELAVVEVNEINELKSKYLNMFLDLYKRSIELSDMRACNDILKSILKLQNLDVQKIETKIEGNTNINLTNVTDEKLDELINKLIDNNKIDG